jgi:hypothetical protein
MMMTITIHGTLADVEHVAGYPAPSSGQVACDYRSELDDGNYALR